jgi:inosose dehydratase
MNIAFKLANAPTSWGIEAPLKPSYPTWLQVLDEVAAAGYAGIELGPFGFLPTDPDVLHDALSARDLALVAGTVMEAFHDPSETSRTISLTDQIARVLASQSATLLVAIFSIISPREETAGRTADAVRLSAEELGVAIQTLRRVTATAADHGVTTVLHAHAGTHLEFADEIQLLADKLPDTAFCVDTGHAAYAGIDAAEWIEALGNRLVYVHLKDVDPAVLAEARAKKLGFTDAVGAGIFSVLGEGVSDLTEIFAALVRIQYRGWLTVEQDRMLGSSSTPLQRAVSSREFLDLLIPTTTTPG